MKRFKKEDKNYEAQRGFHDGGDWNTTGGPPDVG